MSVLLCLESASKQKYCWLGKQKNAYLPLLSIKLEVSFTKLNADSKLRRCDRTHFEPICCIVMATRRLCSIVLLLHNSHCKTEINCFPVTQDSIRLCWICLVEYKWREVIWCGTHTTDRLTTKHLPVVVMCSVSGRLSQQQFLLWYQL